MPGGPEPLAAGPDDGGAGWALPGVARLVARVREETGVDLAGYRTDGLVRRTRQRAALRGAVSLEEYLARVDAAEAHALLDHVLVQVSGWFRDPYVWTSLRTVVLPGIAARRGGPVALRAWVAGCAEGQEVWSLAACLAEAVDAGHLASWDLLATDLEGTVLATVAAGTYPPASLPDPVPDVLAPHVVRTGDGWHVSASLTAHVRVARHDVRDPAPADLGGPADLVLCRNLLIYLDDPTRGHVLDRLVDALRPGGVLVLGHAEVPLERRHVLVPVDVAARAYRSIGAPVPMTGTSTDGTPSAGTPA